MTHRAHDSNFLHKFFDVGVVSLLECISQDLDRHLAIVPNS